MQMRGHTPNGSSSHSTGAARRVRCVLWTPRGVAPPLELEQELDRKGIARAAADNAHAAMALLCAWANRPDAAGPFPLRVVVLVEPEMLLDARALLDALDRYAPDAARWAYRRGANPALRALVEQDVPPLSVPSRPAVFAPPARPIQRDPSPTSPLQTHPVLPRPERRPLPPARPSLRLTDHPAPTLDGAADDGLGDLNPPDARVGARTPDGAQSPTNVLTDEELAMLLGDNPDHDAPRKRRRKGEGTAE